MEIADSARYIAGIKYSSDHCNYQKFDVHVNSMFQQNSLTVFENQTSKNLNQKSFAISKRHTDNDSYQFFALK